MRYVDPWSILGIGQTRDVQAIRRAYAARLKDVHPEDDPEGFQALRGAYEAVMAMARPRVSAAQRVGPVRFSRKGRRSAPMPLDPSPLDDEADRSDAPEDTPPPKPAPEPAPEPAPLPEAPPRHEGFSALRDEAPPSRPGPPDDDLQAFEAARLALMDLLHGAQRPSREAVVEAVRALLASPALMSLEVHDRTERWLANLVLSDVIGAEYVLGPADDHFQWLDSDVRRSQLSFAIDRRHEEIARFARIASPTSTHARGYLALTSWSERKRAIEVHLSPSLRGHVAEILAHSETDRFLARRLDPEAVAWWREWLSRPRFPSWGIQGAVLSAVIAGLSAALGGLGVLLVVVWTVTSAAAFAGVTVAWLHLVSRPRQQILAGEVTLPAWAVLGWAPLSLVVFALSTIVPPSWPGGLALAALAIGSLVWAGIVSQPDRTIHPGGTPWRTRLVFGFAWVGVVWLITARVIYPAVLGQLAVPLLSAAAAFSLGSGTLGELWDRLAPWARGAWAGLILALASGGLFAIWGWPGGIVLLSIAVLLRKGLDVRLSRAAQRGRDLAPYLGILLWPIVIAVMNVEGLGASNFWLIVGALILWTSTVIVVVAQARAIMFPARRRRPGELA